MSQLPDRLEREPSIPLSTFASEIVDMGSAGSKFFADKIERYLELRRDGGWRVITPSWPGWFSGSGAYS